jgi:choline dehydrogenase-like flavoprotein
VLRLHKDFTTLTSAVCEDDSCLTRGPVQALPDQLDLTLTVPASGRFEWAVGPSTRPYVGARGGREAWTLSCSLSGGVAASRAVVAGRGQIAAVDACDPADRTVVASNPAASGRPRVDLAVGRATRSALAGRGAPVEVRCAVGCIVRATARVRGRAVGSVLARVGAGAARHVVRVRADAAGRRALRRAGRGARVAVLARARDETGLVRSARRVLAG